MRYTVQSPDERSHTNHRSLSGASARVNWLLNHGHSDIDVCFSTDEGFERHILLNETVTAVGLLGKMQARAEECGLRFSRWFIGGRR